MEPSQKEEIQLSASQQDVNLTVEDLSEDEENQNEDVNPVDKMGSSILMTMLISSHRSSTACFLTVASTELKEHYSLHSHRCTHGNGGPQTNRGRLGNFVVAESDSMFLTVSRIVNNITIAVITGVHT